MSKVPLLLALFLAGCASGGGDDDAPTLAGQPSTSVAAPTAAGPCGLRPLTFTNERWTGSAASPPGEGGVVWE